MSESTIAPNLLSVTAVPVCPFPSPPPKPPCEIHVFNAMPESAAKPKNFFLTRNVSEKREQKFEGRPQLYLEDEYYQEYRIVDCFLWFEPAAFIGIFGVAIIQYWLLRGVVWFPVVRVRSWVWGAAGLFVHMVQPYVSS